MFSVTAEDCEWQYFKGSGDGGQKRQKTSSGARCSHKPSGAVGEATDTRSQLQNRKLAFERMANSPEFQVWIKLEIDCRLGKVEIEEADEKGRKQIKLLKTTIE
jgi:protein subunit release factor B